MTESTKSIINSVSKSKQPTYEKLKESTSNQELAFDVDETYQNDHGVVIPKRFTVNYKQMIPRKLPAIFKQFLDKNIILDINTEFRSIKWIRKSYEYNKSKAVKDAMFWIPRWKFVLLLCIIVSGIWTAFLAGVLGGFVRWYAFSTSLMPFIIKFKKNCAAPVAEKLRR